MNNEQYYIVRTIHAGVFFGKILYRNRDEIKMTDVRRLWHWSGATECIGLSANGVSRPDDCKFTVRASEMEILGVIEVIPCTEKATASLKGVSEWMA